MAWCFVFDYGWSDVCGISLCMFWLFWGVLLLGPMWVGVIVLPLLSIVSGFDYFVVSLRRGFWLVFVFFGQSVWESSDVLC